jgi:hypothetical protein
MSTASARTQTITLTGDVTATLTSAALQNPASPGVSQITNLAIGSNTITAPTGGSTPVAVTIIPPAGNVQAITLKGIAGDTGILLHPTDPSTIALGPTVASFVLNAGGVVTGLRLIWS